MKMRRMLFCTFALALALPLIAEEKSPVKPGKWEMIIQMDIPGMPVKMQPIKNTTCITKEQAENPAKSVPTGASKDNGCKVADMKVSGNVVTYTVTCEKPKATVDAEMKYEGDSFEGTMRMKVEGQDEEITTKYTGKRIGDC